MGFDQRPAERAQMVARRLRAVDAAEEVPIDWQILRLIDRYE
jgi:hypothetical protein